MSLIDVAGYQRILKNQPATLSMTVYDGSTIIDPGVTTITVTTADGTVLVTAGAATTGTGAAERTYALTTADTANLDLLTVAWATTNYGVITTYAGIVGNRLFTLTEARAADRMQLADSSIYTDAALDEARSRIEDDFQDICGQSFIPRYVFEHYDGRGTQFFMLRHWSDNAPDVVVRSIDYRTIGTLTWTAFTPSELSDVFVDNTGLLRRELGVPFWLATQNVRIGYEYGYKQVPLAIKRAALRLLVSSTAAGQVSTNLPERATSFATADGTFRLATPGMRGSWYGLPEVDAVLARFSERTRAFA